MPRVPHSKITVPELPPGFSSRPGLLAELDRAGPDRLLVLSAPAGYGKTLLLADWVGRRGPPTAWVTVDGGDDSLRLWSAALAAVRAVVPANQAGQIGPGVEYGDLLEEIEAFGGPLRLVFDDVHELTDSQPLRELARLTRRRPANLRLVLSGRADPPLSLPRLRLEGRLHELRADRLRFSVDDATTLLRMSGLDLPSEQIARLYQRTEGWAAGLRLAALALQRADDPAAFIEQFSGDERSMSDYLTGEVLYGLRPEVLDFLQAMSVCTRLPAALAVVLSDRQDAAQMLDELRRETALIERSAPTTYRMHSLLRTHLAADLQRRSPARHRHLHGLAARWWAEADEPAHALRHAERAGDKDLLAELLRGTGVWLVLSGESMAVRHGLDAVGPAGAAADPWLMLTAALTHVEERALPAAAADLRQARRAWPGGNDPALEILRVGAELLGAGSGLAAGTGPLPPVGDDPNAPEFAGLLHWCRGAVQLGQGGGDQDRAQHELDLAVQLARTHGFGYLEAQAHSTTAVLAWMRRDHAGMVRAAENAVGTATRYGRPPPRWAAEPLAMLAYADLLAGDPAAAGQRAGDVLASPDPVPAETIFTLRSVRGAALADGGHRAAGLAEMQAARADADGTLWPPCRPTALAVLEHRVALLLGDHGAADEALAWLTSSVGQVGEVLVLTAWADLAAGRYEPARAIAETMSDEPVDVLLPHTPIEVLLIRAEAALHTGDRATATAALDRALRMGEEVGIVRPFALAGPLVRHLLPSRPSARAGSFATQLAGARAVVVADTDELLTERELAVLELLPSLLTAAEIADELTVSVNTVKSHIRSIYAKLGASSRRQAIQRAGERDLLTR